MSNGLERVIRRNVPADPQAAPPPASAGLAEPELAYDYYKNMVSVSFAILGGVLTLGETVFGARLAPWQMGVAALPVAVSGLLALQGKTDIMQLIQGLKPPLNTARIGLRIVPALYGSAWACSSPFSHCRTSRAANGRRSPMQPPLRHRRRSVATHRRSSADSRYGRCRST
jgi:hypothetical protein